jgi:hypothetical protein
MGHACDHIHTGYTNVVKETVQVPGLYEGLGVLGAQFPLVRVATIVDDGFLGFLLGFVLLVLLWIRLRKWKVWMGGSACGEENASSKGVDLMEGRRGRRLD